MLQLMTTSVRAIVAQCFVHADKVFFKLLVILVGPIIAVLSGCNSENSFQGKSGLRKPVVSQVPQDAMSLSSNCANPSILVSRQELAARNGDMVVTGEFCAQNSSDLQVLFLLDFSGSMKTNDPGIGGWNFSCGRSRAVQAIAQAIRASSSAQDQVTVGVLGFGDTTRNIVSDTSLSAFSYNGPILCGSGLGGTKYGEAFTSATRVLQQSPRKNKLLYFITDGEPSDSFVGTSAASTMRSAIPGLAFNAILLQSSGGNWSGGGGGQDPRTYLSGLTGDPSRVRIVSEANALATQAVQLLARPVIIDQGTVVARLVDPVGGIRNVPIASFLQSGGGQSGSLGGSTWSYATDRFKIEDARPGVYQLVIEGVEASGSKKSTTVTLTIQ